MCTVILTEAAGGKRPRSSGGGITYGDNPNKYARTVPKEDLTAAVVERATERWVSALEASEPGPAAPSEAIVAWIQRSVEDMGRRLPFFMRLSLLLGLELGPREPALMERLRRGQKSAS